MDPAGGPPDPHPPRARPPVTEPGPILQVDGVRTSFRRGQVLKSAGFSAHSGRITVLMGRNGAGKSSLFRVAVGRMRADSGRILYKGEPVETPTLAGLARRGLMYLPQETGLTQFFSIRQHLEAMARSFGGSSRLESVLEELKLGELQRRRPRHVSGGERRRAALALALVRQPDCLLMDEPFSGIDPTDRELVQGGLRSLREAGTAVVISGHDVEDLFELADDVIWVTAGTSHWLGTPAEARVHSRFSREYLGEVPGSRPSPEL
ncbi:MAG: ABC transporter ATP-binding protein [Gemmatimonadales bacterium]|nr:MAG: ABC transporter ATP-binding protein [Gemmatimonadales bacterium]